MKSDADFACMAKLKNLKWLQISCSIRTNGMDITGQGLQHLAGLTELERIVFGGPNLKDDDFRHLRNLQKLSSIGVFGGSLTDDCLSHLEALPSLVSLRIYMEDDITDKALARLDRKMPNLHRIEIHRDEKKNNSKKKR